MVYYRERMLMRNSQGNKHVGQRLQGYEMSSFQLSSPRSQDDISLLVLLHVTIHMEYCQSGKLTWALVSRISIKSPSSGHGWLIALMTSVSSPSRGWLIFHDQKPPLQITFLLSGVASPTLNHILRLFSVTQGLQANKDTTTRQVPFLLCW